MIISGWGRYPTIEATVATVRSAEDARAALAQGGPVLARGLGRSYGDSSLAPRALDMTALDAFVRFDPESGTLTAEAGASLAGIIAAFLPRGWFLPVTPGTRFVTLGGAIASDVHGKNHHVDGAFSDHVSSLRLLVASGEVLDVSRTEHPELFAATCGGMGLTGVILEASVRLLRVGSSMIDETVLKVPDLAAALAAFDEHRDTRYSVAWIDLSASGPRLGRGLVMVGDHAPEGDRDAGRDTPRLGVPFPTPAGLLNRASIRAFNTLYYERVRRPVTRHLVGYQPFFYPLDGIADWNRLYGRDGLIQYQFVIPFADGVEVLHEAVRRIARSGLASPLAVLKVFGDGNANPLSFPMAGYTLALDLKATPASRQLAAGLDRLVIEAGGRHYLTKDSLMSRETFLAGYPRVEEFESIRRKYGATGVFVSEQSRRLGLA